MNTEESKKPDIILVDDHLIFRQGLKSLITIENIANVIGEASNGKEFIALIAHQKPDLVLMDIDMPHMNGMEATRQAMEIMPDIKIIAFTMYSDEEYYLKMIELGVKGFILKSSGVSEVEKAIRDVAKGGSYFSNELFRKIINNLGLENTKNHAGLVTFTDREIEILQQICYDLTPEEIAEKLNISIETLKSHRSNLLGIIDQLNK